MKTLTNKQKLIAISIFIVLFGIAFLLGMFVTILRNNNTNDLQLSNQNVNVFYATIEEIYGGGTHILVKGLDINNINYRSEFRFSISDDTELIWRGTNINVSSLKVGQNISVTHTGDVLETYPAQLTKVTKIIVLDDQIEENINNKVTTIDIETAFETEQVKTKLATLNQEEIYQIFNIIDNLEFSKETCDGLPKYVIKYNSESEKEFIKYGIEIYSKEYHITSAEKGEAILSTEQKNKIGEIINKYF